MSARARVWARVWASMCSASPVTVRQNAARSPARIIGMTDRMFQVLPGVGLLLPGRAGTLRFGMGERAAQWAVATLADVREGWVCGAGWAFGARYEGVALE